MTSADKKLLIAKWISDREYVSYDEFLEYLNDNQYRFILKCPKEMFVFGIKNHWINPKISLQDIKDFVLDVIQYSGIECTFKDDTWEKLKIIPKDPNNQWSKEKLNSPVGYMMDFFETQ